MGLYDSLTIDMPLPGDQHPPPDTVWQTKDLGCSMAEFRIEADGRLRELHVETEPDGEEWSPLLGMMWPLRREVSRRWLVREHHGLVRLLGVWRGELWEYEAKFTDGPCVGLRLVRLERLPGGGE